MRALDIKPSHIDSIKAARRGENAIASINHFVRAVKQLYNWAEQQRLLPDNPVRHVRRLPREAPEKKALRLKQVDAIIALGDKNPPLVDYMRMLSHTGTRRGGVRRPAMVGV